MSNSPSSFFSLSERLARLVVSRLTSAMSGMADWYPTAVRRSRNDRQPHRLTPLATALRRLWASPLDVHRKLQRRGRHLIENHLWQSMSAAV